MKRPTDSCRPVVITLVGRTSSGNDLTPSCQLANLLSKHT
jgi:hypothetical protein